MLRKILNIIRNNLVPIIILLFLISLIYIISSIIKPKSNDEKDSVSSSNSNIEVPETEKHTENETGKENTVSTEESTDPENNTNIEEENENNRTEKGIIESTAGEEEKIRPVNEDMLYLATDIHYYVSSLTDYTTAFTDYMNIDDGKDIKDVEKILDVWIKKVKEERPAVVIISGDNTLNGEKVAHEELAKKLQELTDDGITVLAVPGNHDINNPNSATYYGDTKEFTANIITGDEFYEIYKNFGYDQSFSRDLSSLSYAYRYDDGRIILMLDSAVYEPSNRVYGTIKEETLKWMESVLKEAGSSPVIVSAHHNLLSESRLYTSEVTLTNNSEVIKLLKKYNVNLYLSGHLHLQRIREYKSEPGITDENSLYEVVTGSFAMYPFPYGKIIWNSEGLSYKRESVDTDKELFQSGKDEFIRVYSVKIGSRIRNIPDYIRESIYKSYIRLIMAYVSGEIFDEKDFKESDSYSYIERFIRDSDTNLEIEKMLKDTKVDNTYLNINYKIDQYSINN